MTEAPKKDDEQSTEEKIATQAELGGRTMAAPPGGSGISSGLQPGGTTPATGSLGGIGSLGVRGASSGGDAPGVRSDGTSGASGMPTNDTEPGGGTVGPDDPKMQGRPGPG